METILIITLFFLLLGYGLDVIFWRVLGHIGLFVFLITYLINK